MLLIVSVGTGAAVALGATAASPNKNIVATVGGLPGELMYGIQVEQDINCRTVGRCTYGERLDREVLDMVARDSTPGMTLDQRYAAPLIPLTNDLGRHFLYARYNADLSATGLAAAGFKNVNASSIQKMDAVENMETLLAIGQKAAGVVSAAHLGSFY